MRYIVGVVRPTLKLSIGLEIDMKMGLRGCLGIVPVFDSYDAAKEYVDRVGVGSIIEVEEYNRTTPDETSYNARAHGVQE